MLIIIFLIVFSTTIYIIVPLSYLFYGVINFSIFFFTFVILFTHNERLKYLKKHSNSKFVFFYFKTILILFPIILFSVIFIFFYLILLFYLVPNASLFFDLFPRTVLAKIEYTKIKWLSLIYVLIINFLLSSLFFFLLIKGSKQKILGYFVVFSVIFLFDGGFFINFNLDKETLSSYGTKKFIKEFHFNFSTMIKFINPYFWINMFSSTIFLTFDPFINFSEFHMNINDVYSVCQLFIPLLFIFILFIYLLIYDKFSKKL